MKRLGIVVIFLLISSNAEACIKLLSEDLKFHNRDGKTTGFTLQGVIQNQCSRPVRHATVEFRILDNNDVPKHVFKHEVEYQTEPGEMTEFEFYKSIKFSPDQFEIRTSCMA